MAKDIRERANDSFDENDKEGIRQYFDWLRATILDYLANIRRMTTILLLLVAVFELVIGSRKTEISIGSFTVSRTSIVLVFLPAVIAFLYVQTLWDSIRTTQLDNAAGEIFKKWSAKASENDLDHLLIPSQMLFWMTLGDRLQKTNETSSFRLTRTTSTILLLIFILGIFAFEGQAYYALFPSRAYGFYAWAISLAITLLCLLLSVLELGFWIDEP